MLIMLHPIRYFMKFRFSFTGQGKEIMFRRNHRQWQSIRDGWLLLAEFPRKLCSRCAIDQPKSLQMYTVKSI